MTVRDRKELNVLLYNFQNCITNFYKIPIDLKQSLVRQKIVAQRDQKGKQRLVWANLAAWKETDFSQGALGGTSLKNSEEGHGFPERNPWRPY